MENQEKINYFEERVLFWQKMLGIYNYEMRVFENVTDPNELRGKWICKIDSKIINVYYSKEWLLNDEVTFYEIDKVTFHEVYESQFVDVRYYLSDFLNKLKIDEITHDIVKRAENTIFEKLRSIRLT